MNRLQKIADYHVIHDREIHIRTDDSVARVWRNKVAVLRRSRGYVPFPLRIPSRFEKQILACGAELKNTFCLARDHFAFMSHHIGDLENAETLAAFESGIEHFKRIFSIRPEVVAYDLHPDYLSTRYALGLPDLPKIGVQHHHAHAVSCMGDNGIEGEVIGVSFDGTGYGPDGRIWGAEFLVCDESSYQRAAHLEYAPLPGGDRAIKEPWRIAASYLYKVFGDQMLGLGIEFVERLDPHQWTTIRKMIDQSINTPQTSSAGRLFDAVSALTGIRRHAYYEGQAAIELEAAAGEADGGYAFEIAESETGLSILLAPMVRGIVADISGGTAVSAISARFHNTIAAVIADVCLKIRKSYGLDRVVLSGGVFQNVRLLDRTFDLLSGKDFAVFTHHRVPTNDGGIALGQALIANARMKKGRV